MLITPRLMRSFTHLINRDWSFATSRKVLMTKDKGQKEKWSFWNLQPLKKPKKTNDNNGI